MGAGACAMGTALPTPLRTGIIGAVRLKRVLNEDCRDPSMLEEA